MTDCRLSKIDFARCCGRRVQVDFAGGDISSNGGVPLLSAADRRHRHGPRPGRRHPPQAAQDRRRRHPKLKARQPASLKRLPGQGPVPPCCRKAQARIAPRQDGTKTTIRSTSAAFGLAKNCQNPPVNTGKTPPSPRRHPKLRQRQAEPPAKQNRQQSRKTSYFTIVRDQSGPGSVPSDRGRLAC